jgi:energy-coupling factor transport system substrate-specific component
MATLAALGGMGGSVVSLVGKAVQATLGTFGGLQWLAGIHVLWLVLAVGLVRRPGAATLTGLLKGAVELLSGNPHGLLVLLYSGAAGVTVDGVWLLFARRHGALVYALAGGAAAATNLLVLKLVADLPTHGALRVMLSSLTLIAFASGAVLAGLLGWWLIGALSRAGATGASATPG